MILGLIKSNFPGERRVPLLPKDIQDFDNDLLVEEGFGSLLDIEDADYERKGCRILSREEVFKQAEAIFSLKLIQPFDYPHIRNNQLIIGWTHPYGSGSSFMKEQAKPKDLVVVDLDNNSPKIFYEDEVCDAGIPQGILYRNSFYAGAAGAMDALLKYGLIPDESVNIAVLGSGNVSQGAFYAVSKFTSKVRMFYRRTMPVFKDTLDAYDIIINGIEVGPENEPILSLQEQKKLKRGAFIIDTAADAGNAIQGDHFTKLSDSIYKENGLYYYVVPNTPSIAYRNISKYLSRQLSRYVFKEDTARFNEIRNHAQA
ncbi:Rossmann-fold NAD(P)-binding domain-containing protein [Lactovum odontotermitis]